MEYVIKTDVGVVRSENQDKAAFFSKEGQALAILCDGMGGHSGGSEASRIAVDTFEKAFQGNINESSIYKWFLKTINKTKEQMVSFANKDKKLLDMGTTLTAAFITDQKIYVFNIGDSRTYFYHSNLQQITRDHNLRNYYIDKYNYSPEEAAKIMGAAALTSALGPEKAAKIDRFEIDKNQNIKYVILTSDGVHDYISKPLFERIIENEEKIENKADEMIKQAIRGKSSDNLTILLLKVGAK